MKKYLGILGGFLGSLLLLTGCSFAAKLEYDSADAADNLRANGSRDLFGTFADIEIVSGEDGRQIEFMDKMALLIKNYDELKQDYLYYQ